MNRSASEDNCVRAMHAWHADDVPAEILLDILAFALETYPTISEIGVAAKNKPYYPLVRCFGLRALALVGRAWYRLVSLVLYRKFALNTDIDTALRHSSVISHAPLVTIRSAHPLTLSVGPLRRNPDAFWLVWYGPPAIMPKPLYHPFHARILWHANRRLTSITRLDLHDVNFMASFDLLQLLTLFTSLDISYTRRSLCDLYVPADIADMRQSGSTDPHRQEVQAAWTAFPRVCPHITRFWKQPRAITWAVRSRCDACSSFSSTPERVGHEDGCQRRTLPPYCGQRSMRMSETVLYLGVQCSHSSNSNRNHLIQKRNARCLHRSLHRGRRCHARFRRPRFEYRLLCSATPLKCFLARALHLARKAVPPLPGSSSALPSSQLKSNCWPRHCASWAECRWK